MKNPSNLQTLKSDNRTLILNEIRKTPLSRAQLSKKTKLTKSAVSMIVNAMIQDGQLKETQMINTPKGRKPILIDIVADLYYAAGIELHREYISVVITDLKSTIIAHSSVLITTFNKPETAVNWICKSINSICTTMNISLNQLIGIGISSPGPLDHFSGKILNPPNFDLFQNINIKKMIQKYFNLPVILENNALLLGMLEYFSGEMKHYQNSLFVVISHGIGSCLIINGEIYRGKAGFAGELGHISIDKNGPICSCGNKGCLELYATLNALKKRFHFNDYKKIIDQAYQDDSAALSIVDYEAECLAAAFINAINLLDLDSIFITGEITYKMDLLLSKIHHLINQQSLISNKHQINISKSSLGENASAIASTAAVLNCYFNNTLSK